jgi:hypothetical protein
MIGGFDVVMLTKQQKSNLVEQQQSRAGGGVTASTAERVLQVRKRPPKQEGSACNSRFKPEIFVAF